MNSWVYLICTTGKVDITDGVAAETQCARVRVG